MQERFYKMCADLNYNYGASRAWSETQKNKWQELCASYLPITPENSIWRYSRASNHDDPDQGWKLHISATILTANRLFEAIAPLLQSHGCLFKAPSSLQELDKINAGLYYGYSQVGKFTTVYPHSAEAAVLLAQCTGRIHRWHI